MELGNNISKRVIKIRSKWDNYDIKLIYIPGPDNVEAESLSRQGAGKDDDPGVPDKTSEWKLPTTNKQRIASIIEGVRSITKIKNKRKITGTEKDEELKRIKEKTNEERPTNSSAQMEGRKIKYKRVSGLVSVIIYRCSGFSVAWFPGASVLGFGGSHWPSSPIVFMIHLIYLAKCQS